LFGHRSRVGVTIALALVLLAVGGSALAGDMALEPNAEFTKSRTTC
jgi:hypothetical protein